MRLNDYLVETEDGQMMFASAANLRALMVSVLAEAGSRVTVAVQA